MRYFAKVENNKLVSRVILIDDQVSDATNFISNNLKLSGDWIETKKESPTQKNFAGVGFSYDSTINQFIPARPFDSWLLSEETYQWSAPKPLPDNDKNYVWVEQELSWQEVEALGTL